MSRSDPSAASGQHHYDIRRCACAHLVTFHVIGVNHHRGACSASTCPCRHYKEA